MTSLAHTKTNGRPAVGNVTISGQGNTGSFATDTVGRMLGPGDSVRLVDFDHYEEHNCEGQNITPRDVGRPKVDVGCRLYDLAVDAAGQLVRLACFAPGPDAACLLCSWGETDHKAALEELYPCRDPSATHAPAHLGMAAAGLLGAELKKLLDGDMEHALCQGEVQLDLRHHTHSVTRWPRRNPACEFDHEIWRIEPLALLPAKLTLAGIRSLVADDLRGSADWALRVESHPFVRMQYCPGCGNHARHGLCLAGRIPPRRRVCTLCGATMVVRGFDMIETLEGPSIRAAAGRRSLASMGFPGRVHRRHPARPAALRVSHPGAAHRMQAAPAGACRPDGSDCLRSNHDRHAVGGASLRSATVEHLESKRSAPASVRGAGGNVRSWSLTTSEECP